MRFLFASLFFIGYIVALQGEVVRQNDNQIKFGTDRFSVSFDAQTGAMLGLNTDGVALLSSDNSGTPFDLKLENGRVLGSKADFKLINYRQNTPDELALTIKIAEFTVTANYQILADKKMLRSKFILTGPQDQAVKIYGFRNNLPQATFLAGSYYDCPTFYPVFEKRTLAALSPGRVVQNWRDPCPTIIQFTPARTLVLLQDRSQPYGDIGRTEIKEQKTGITVTQTTESGGILSPGETWTIGDFYCVYQECDGDTALLRIHEWMKNIGMTVPANRNPTIKNTVLYSFHPGMPGHPFQDWGGFKASTGQLSRISKLNCNTIWILPVESECPYIPDDFYRMANGVGTPEEYKTLIDTAHQLGMKAWQDVVPHGGRNTCQRARQHPNWLIRNEAGKIPPVRCFDYNNPEWQNYLGEVVRFYTQTYQLDGWRIDTSGFSMHQNWSETLPYGRGSWAMGQGGLNMMNFIRNSARQANPQAVTLGECDGSIYGTAADAVYDFPFCRQVFKSILTLPPDEFVRQLTLWLHQQKYAELKDLVRLRYVESHDEPRAELLYGPEPMRAGVALSAWIDGIPMLYKEMEDGHSEILSRIMKLRQSVPELAVGDTYYPGCETVPGVFAAIRTDGKNCSVVLINFNPTATAAKITLPLSSLPEGKRDAVQAADLWQGTLIPLSKQGQTLTGQMNLDAYKFTVLRIGSPIIALPKPPEKNSSQPMAFDAFILNQDGSKTMFPPTDAVSDKKILTQQLSGSQALIFKINTGGRTCTWQAKSAVGTVKDVFRTRHPFYQSMANNMYSLPSGHNVLYTTLTQPFGLDESNAEISFSTDDSSLQFSFPPKNRPAAVFILDRIGDDHNLYLAVVKRVPDTPILTAEENVSVRISTAEKNNNSTAATGDKRLLRIAGGWMFDNGKIRLRIAANGTMIGYQEHLPDGDWREQIRNLRIDLNGGYTGRNEQFSSLLEMEAFSLIQKNADGSLLLRFFGRPRGKTLYSIVEANTLNYFMEYQLGDDNAFGFRAAIRLNTKPSEKQMRLALSAEIVGAQRLLLFDNGQKIGQDKYSIPAAPKTSPVPDQLEIDKTNGKIILTKFTAAGNPPEKIILDHETLSCIWYQSDMPGDRFGQWQTISGAIGSGGAPVPGSDLGERTLSTTDHNILDGSFEFDYWGAFSDTVQMYMYALPWKMPYGSIVDTTSAQDGHNSVKIVFDGKEKQYLSQSLAPGDIKPRDQWKLSAWVKTEKLVDGKIEMGVFSRSQTATVKIPDGDQDYRYFEVDFTVPEMPGPAEIRIGGKAASGAIRVDNVRWQKTEPKN